MSGRAAELLEGRGLFLLFVAAVVVTTIVYFPALDGPPISDDFAFLVSPWVLEPTPAKLLALLDPWSDASNGLRNFAPIRGLLNAFQAWAHPQNSLLYHGLNVVLHAGTSVLFALFLRSTGIAAALAIVAATFFLVHPANVEAVAWMSQVWNPLALGFALLALLRLPRHPREATLWFALSLLSKPLAVFALAAAAALAWSRTDRNRVEGGPAPAAPDPPRFGWIAVWAVLTLLFVLAQLVAYGDAAPREHLHEDAAVVVRSMATFALRYFGMALSSYGVSSFHEPPLPLTWTDPVWLLALVVLGALGVRLIVTLRDRRPEAAGWIWMLAAFAPVSQIVPFLYPMADRYLYFMLPGLLLALGHAGTDLFLRTIPEPRRPVAGQVLLVAALVVCVGLSVRSFERARIWRAEDAVLVDAARHYPDGVSALLLGARRAATQEDVTTSVALLRRAAEKGWDFWNFLNLHPDFAQIRTNPRFRELIVEFAGARITRVEARRQPTQMELSDLAEAHAVRGERDAALAALDRALARGGPLDAQLRARRNQLARGSTAR